MFTYTGRKIIISKVTKLVADINIEMNKRKKIRINRMAKKK